MLASQIAKYLDDQDIVDYKPEGTDGDVFINILPSSPDHAVGIYPTGGLTADMGLAYDTPTVQIITRGGMDPRPPYNLAVDIYGALHGFASDYLDPEAEDALWVVRCEGIQSDPAEIGRDDSGRHRFSINFQLEVYRPSMYRGE